MKKSNLNQNEIRRNRKGAQKSRAQKRAKKNSDKKGALKRYNYVPFGVNILEICNNNSNKTWKEFNKLGRGGEIVIKLSDGTETVITKKPNKIDFDIVRYIWEIVEKVPKSWKDKWFDLSPEKKSIYRDRYEKGDYVYVSDNRGGLEINEAFWFLKDEGLEYFSDPNYINEDFILYYYEIYNKNKNADIESARDWWSGLQDWTYFTDRCKVDPKGLGRLYTICFKIDIEKCLSYFKKLYIDELNCIVKILKFIRDEDINIFIESLINDAIDIFDISIVINIFEKNWKGKSNPVSLKGLFSIIKQAKWAHHINNESIIENKVWYSKECHIKEKMEELFLDKFGRCPKIIDSIYIFSIVNNINYREIVDRFNVKSIKKLIDQYGVSIALYINYLRPELNGLDKEMIDSIKSRNLSNDSIQWILNHKKTSRELLLEIIRNMKWISKVVDIKSATLDEIKKALNEKRSLKEYIKIKEKYLFSELQCSIKNTEVQNENQFAFILDANSPKQTTLGYDTHCCQRLGGAGESAMMYGMLAENAGFWAIEQKHKVVAQAEIWLGLLDNKEVLVFDNIELANNRDFNLIRRTLEKWLEASPYQNIIMGTGCNELSDEYCIVKGTLVQPKCDLVPNPYTDAKECVWLKRGGEVQYVKENKKDE